MFEKVVPGSALAALVLMGSAGCAEEPPQDQGYYYNQPQPQGPNPPGPMAGGEPSPVNPNGPVAENPGPGPNPMMGPTSVEPGPAVPGPMNPGPMNPGPMDPGPMDPGPMDPGPVDPGPVDPGPTARIPKCVDDQNNVVIVGDSYINWASHTLPADLIRESGQTWPMYAVGGSSMATGGLTGFIPDQLENALRINPNIQAVVMDGGGNDILIPAATWIGGADCKNNRNSPDLQVCRDIVQAAVDRAIELMDRAASAGITETVYFFYPHVPEGTVIGGAAPNAILDYSLPLARDACESALERTDGKLRCTFVDMVPEFEGKSGLFAAADIHPNAMGSAVMAKAIWREMLDRCIAQPSSSGCCEP